MPIGELHGSMAGCKITADGDECFEPSLPCSSNDRFSVMIVSCIVEVRVGIDQHRAHRSMSHSL
jgi:hypothetical protein